MYTERTTTAELLIFLARMATFRWMEPTYRYGPFLLRHK
jgi:hypothetical protein